jgi:hypothetical protein
MKICATLDTYRPNCIQKSPQNQHFLPLYFVVDYCPVVDYE